MPISSNNIPDPRVINVFKKFITICTQNMKTKCFTIYPLRQCTLYFKIGTFLGQTCWTLWVSGVKKTLGEKFGTSLVGMELGYKSPDPNSISTIWRPDPWPTTSSILADRSTYSNLKTHQLWFIQTATLSVMIKFLCLLFN